MIRWLCVCTLIWMLFLQSGCFSSSTLEPTFDQIQQSAIYDQDNRVYTDDHPDSRLRALGDAVVLFMSYSNVVRDEHSDKVTLKSSSLNDRIKNSSSYNKKPLCSSEPFRLDPAPGSCTGFLVGPKLLATAGHCISKDTSLTVQAAQSWCNYRAFILGFKKGRALTDKDVYRCARVLVHGYSTSPRLDYALIELDREVKHVQPLPYEAKPTLQKGDHIAIIGYPHGTWQKIADGAKVYELKTSDYFTTTLDSMPGNSGSPVFSLKSYKVVGIHVRGARPVYKVDTQKDCNVSYVIRDKKGRQSENYMNKLLGPACTRDTDCSVRTFCDSGRCVFRGMELEIKAFKLSAQTGAFGDTVQAEVALHNTGNFDIQQKFRIGLWWSSNSTLCSTCGKDISIQSFVVQGGLQAGASLKQTFTFTVTKPFVSGKQYVGVYLDDFRYATQKYSYYGDVAERVEANNKTTLPFTVQSCQPTCTQEKSTRCVGADVEVCRMGKDSCLHWQKQETCTSTFRCEKGMCVQSCKDVCSTSDSPRCQGSSIEVCVRSQAGCLNWEKQKECSGQEVCTSGQCVVQKSAEGSTCSSDDACQSGLCAQGPNSKICSRSCVEHGECASLKGLPFCLKGSCQKVPKGSCIQTSDCGEDYMCRSGICIAVRSDADAGSPDRGQKTDVPVPPSGCGCSVQTEIGEGWIRHLGLALLLLMWVCRRRR